MILMLMLMLMLVAVTAVKGLLKTITGKGDDCKIDTKTKSATAVLPGRAQLVTLRIGLQRKAGEICSCVWCGQPGRHGWWLDIPRFMREASLVPSLVPQPTFDVKLVCNGDNAPLGTTDHL